MNRPVTIYSTCKSALWIAIIVLLMTIGSWLATAALVCILSWLVVDIIEAADAKRKAEQDAKMRSETEARP